MDKKSIINLEFNKIIEILSENIQTDLGKALARDIRISSDFGEVSYMQDETSEAQKLILEGSNISISQIMDIVAKIKLAAIGSMLDPLSLLQIGQNLRLSRIISDKLSDREDLPILGEKVHMLFSYRDLENKIFDAIISEEEISDNASTELKNIRREIRNTKEKIRLKLNQIVSSDKASKMLQEAIVTQRQDRYVIPVKAEYRSNFPGIVHDTSSSGATIFIEPMPVVEMNNGLRIALQKEREEIERILSELSAEAGAYSSSIQQNQEILSYLDYIMGKGHFSVKTNSISPKLNKNKMIRLKNARHPLIASKEVVPLNLKIGEEYTTLVITGPNTGGKTVTLKTVGLFVLMTQAGLHIPCDFGSSIGIFDNVFSDIGDDQSISQNLSTFSSHMINIVRILDQATDRSLLLLDELGSGTDPDEGSALAISILEHLRNRSVVTIATTHYSNLKSYALNTTGVKNASVEFDVDTLRPTYRLLIGIPGKSNAFFISEKLGLGSDIISSAKMHLHEDTIRMEDILYKIERDRDKISKEKQIIEATSKNIQGRLANIEKKEIKLESSREKIIAQAKKEAQQIVREAKAESDKIIEELRKIRNDSDIRKNIHEHRNSLSALEDRFYTNQALLNDESVENRLAEDFLKEGEIIFVPSFNRNATIVSLDKKKKQAVIQMDNMKINVPFSHLEKQRKEKNEKDLKGIGSISSKKSMHIRPEVDIRGLELDPAIDKLTKYLDDAYLSNLSKVTIIHGIGTGVLKKGVADTLQSINFIKKFRPGEYGEGGQGVTIVDFK